MDATTLAGAIAVVTGGTADAKARAVAGAAALCDALRASPLLKKAYSDGEPPAGHDCDTLQALVARVAVLAHAAGSSGERTACAPAAAGERTRRHLRLPTHARTTAHFSRVPCPRSGRSNSPVAVQATWRCRAGRAPRRSCCRATSSWRRAR